MIFYYFFCKTYYLFVFIVIYNTYSALYCLLTPFITLYCRFYLATHRHLLSSAFFCLLLPFTALYCLLLPIAVIHIIAYVINIIDI